MAGTRLRRALAGGIVVAAFAGLLAAPRGARAEPSTIVVDDGGDAATCSGFWNLRCAIVAANTTPFTNIRFAPNILAVVLQGPLPAITGDGTWIDGTSSNGNPVVRIDGSFWSGAAGSAFAINASNVTLSNLTVVGIPAGGADVRINGGHNTKIVYDYLGIRPGASQCATDTDYGVLLDQDAHGASGTGNGVAYIFGNTISCHGSRGIWVYYTNYVSIGMDQDGNQIGNKIGTTSDGLHPAGNYVGIDVQGDASQNLDIEGNLIADNSTAGVSLAFGAANNKLFGNDIGTDVTGTAVLSNGGDGILVSGGTGTFVSDNQIFYNHGKGVNVLGSGTQAQIQNNRIGANGGLPIDLNGDGPSPNGAHYPPGPNAWLEYPVVDLVNGTSLFGYTCLNCRVFVYRAVGNPQAPGGGGIPLTFVIANSSGQWSVNLPDGMTRADVTFSAVDGSGNTSELSPRPQLMLPLIRR